jgi:signal transduction histidine kinase
MQTELHHLSRKVKVLTRLAEVSMVLNSTWELDALLAYLMDAAAEITDAEAASVLLWNPTTRELYFAATTTSSAALNLINQPVPLQGSIAGAVMREQRVVQVDDVEQDSRHYAKVDETTDFQTRSIIGVPMISKNKPIGVLEVLNKRNLPWDEDDHYYLTSLAAQAAVSIESAQLVMALQKANEEMNSLDKLKNDFIAIASHELRTPLGVILGYSSYLQQSAADDEMNDRLSKVLNSALQLRRIIEDMTNLRYLKQGQADLQQEPVRVSELLTELQNDMLTLSEAKGHHLELALPDEDATVLIDPIRIGMALTNVLNNAIRFTPPGGRICIEAEVRHGEEVWITITDDGIGLTEQQVQRVFEEFYQVEDHMTRRNGGLGIGLSIAKALIEAHGGRIWASSAGIDLGTTFTVTLPLAQFSD